jgi:hypothetical protein
MNIKKQPLTKSTNTSMGSSSTLDEHPCYDSYDSYDNFDLNAWGKGASAKVHDCIIELREEAGSKIRRWCIFDKAIRLAELDETNGLQMEENNLTITI